MASLLALWMGPLCSPGLPGEAIELSLRVGYIVLSPSKKVLKLCGYCPPLEAKDSLVDLSQWDIPSGAWLHPTQPVCAPEFVGLLL